MNEEMRNNLITAFRITVIKDLFHNNDASVAACSTALDFMQILDLREEAGNIIHDVWGTYKTSPEKIEQEYKEIMTDVFAATDKLLQPRECK